MRRLVWFFAWACVAVWSLFCAAAYGVFNLVGGWLARNADLLASDPQTVEWLFRGLSAIQSLSTGAVLVGWGVVSLLILSVPWVLDRAARAQAARSGVPGGRSAGRVGRDGVIDLAPDQYSVGSPSTGAARQPSDLPRGPAPRIGPRG